jgi:hypothetical protein
VLAERLTEFPNSIIHDLNEESIARLKWNFQINGGQWNDTPPELRSLYLAILQWHCNQHSAKHRPTCFKKQKGGATECRFHYPLQPFNETTIDLSKSDATAFFHAYI